MENPYKMSYHIEPPQGLLNDPNGLVQFNGTYYFFHQWNRFGLDHSYKEWGLFTSPDLVRWQSQGSAILPDREEDEHGVHSGSTVVQNGKLYLFYTGSNKRDGVRTSRQCAAVSENGRSFLKLPECVETPPGFTQHHRDPKVFRGRDCWWMLVGTQKEDLTGAVALYSSQDLTHWTYERVLYDHDLDQVCECPDLFSLEGTEILVCCPQTRKPAPDGRGEIVDSYASYIPGAFDEDLGIFQPGGPRQRFDCGFDFYSPQTFLDQNGRRIMTGWMSRMDDEQEAACPTKAYGYIHCLTLPRVLTWEHDTLYQRPVQEAYSLRRNGRTYGRTADSFQAENGHFELLLKRTNPDAPLSLSLRDHTVDIAYWPETHILRVTRQNWVGGGIQSREIPLPELTQLDIFSDASSAEIFVNDGAAVFSMRYFTGSENLRIDYAGLVQGERLEYYTL